MPDPKFCGRCGQPLPELTLACATCGALVYGAALTELSAEARQLEQDGRRDEAQARWRQALALLPPDTTQAQTITRHMETLETSLYQEQISAEERQKRSRWKRMLGPFAGLAFLVWKFKWLLVLAWSKGKVLLFGLTKAKTLFSMLAYVGVYWTAYGWVYAVGIVASIYIHEMGHFWVAQRYGLRPSAPMFIPFLGAFVAMERAPINAGQSARVGLAGPLWGLAAALACLAAGAATGSGAWFAMARTGALLNLFNLIPVWIFDGNFAFRALGRRDRWLILALCLLMLVLTHDGILILVIAGCLYKLFRARDEPAVSDAGVFRQMAVLVVLLSVLDMIRVPLP